MSNEKQLKKLEQRLNKILLDVKEAVDYSISIRNDKEMKREVTSLWKNFLGEFFSYVKQRSKETGDNLLSGFGFPWSLFVK